jgi:hypothetical protein
LLLAAAGLAAGTTPVRSEWLLGAGLGARLEPVRSERSRNVLRTGDWSPYPVDTELRLPEERLAVELALERRVGDRCWLAWLVSGSLDRDQHALPTGDGFDLASAKERVEVKHGSIRMSAGPRIVLAEGPVELSLTTWVTAAVGWVGLKTRDPAGVPGVQGDRGTLSLGARLGLALDRGLTESLTLRIGGGLVELDHDRSLPGGYSASGLALRPRASLLLLWSL